MTEDKIKDLLQRADEIGPGPAPFSANLASAVRRLANQRRITNVAVPLAAAALLLIGFGIWRLKSSSAPAPPETEKIASLETQIQQLQVRTDATLKLIQEVVERQRQQRRVRELEAKLASIPDPLEQIQRQIDKTAFILVYQADRMYRELNRKDSAIQTYNRVIELFPQTRSAEVAKQRLSKIQSNSVNEKELKI